MKDINFKKAFENQTRIQKKREKLIKERKRKELVKKILSTIETLLISVCIYVLTGYFGELAQGSTFYCIMSILCWIWLLGGQFGVYYYIWVGQYER